MKENKKYLEYRVYLSGDPIQVFDCFATSTDDALAQAEEFGLIGQVLEIRVDSPNGWKYENPSAPIFFTGKY